MKFTWYPKHCVIALALLLTFTLALNRAIDVERGAVAGVLAFIVYVCVDVLLTANLAQWWGESVPKNPSAAAGSK